MEVYTMYDVERCTSSPARANFCPTPIILSRGGDSMEFISPAAPPPITGVRNHNEEKRKREKNTSLSQPLNIPKWLKENSHLLQPPINNYCVYNEHMIVMIIGGPNARNDYHINETPEWFYQYKGAMLLKVVDGGEFKDITIDEGEMFLLPPNIPHNPVRFADTVGVVVEQKRPAESLDRLRWYCASCKEIVHEAVFHCTNLGTQIKEFVNKFKDSDDLRRCGACGAMATVAPPAVKA